MGEVLALRQISAVGLDRIRFVTTCALLVFSSAFLGSFCAQLLINYIAR